MKKSLKILLIVAFMATLLLALTGCGNKLVATKETTENGMTFKEKVEVSFKKDKIDKVKMTYTFDDEETAETMKAILTMGMSMAGDELEGLEVEQKGKKVIMKLDAKAFAEMEGASEVDVDKDTLKEQLEEEGYKVK